MDFSSSHLNSAQLYQEKTENEIFAFQMKLLKIIYDDKAFQNLKQNMRKQHRSGFAAYQVVYKFAMDEHVSTADDNSFDEGPPMLCKERLARKQEVANRRKSLDKVQQNLTDMTNDFRLKMDDLRYQVASRSLRKRIHSPPSA